MSEQERDPISTSISRKACNMIVNFVAPTIGSFRNIILQLEENWKNIYFN